MGEQKEKAVTADNGLTKPFYDENGWAYARMHDNEFIRVHVLTDKPRAIKVFKKIVELLEAEFAYRDYSDDVPEAEFTK